MPNKLLAVSVHSVFTETENVRHITFWVRVIHQNMMILRQLLALKRACFFYVF